VVFSNNFSSSSVNPAWSFTGGTWSRAGGLLSSTALRWTGCP
jgi:hypothetical protein